MKIIPKTQKEELTGGSLSIDGLCQGTVSSELDAIAPLLSDMIIKKVGSNGSTEKLPVNISFEKGMKDEQYSLETTKNAINIAAGGYNGALYALQSLRILAELDLKKDKYSVPCIKIEDYPDFGWRGVSLDEARHFFGKDTVKRLLDLMSLHKLNVFHWHLTDDQGWRLEIKSFPRLTEIGSKREKSNINGWRKCDHDNTPHSGFYTQEDAKEIVAYAKKLGIMVVPEIDMPAHFTAAFAAYPHLACREVETEVLWYFGGKYPSTLGIKDWNRSACMGKSTTFEFIYKIIDEICDIFPAPYFHIGGDEAPKAEWKKCPHCQKVISDEGLADEEALQGYFTNKVNEYAKAKGKKLIGWNEILKGKNLDNSVTVQYWTPQRDGRVISYAKNGGKVILSKHQAFYFDMGYNQYPLSNTYSFTPKKCGIDKAYYDNVLGVEGEMWTEWVQNVKKLDMQYFPRMEALSETGWNNGYKNFAEFLERLEDFKKILDAFDVNYAENEVAMPKGFFKRKKEMLLWYKESQLRELNQNDEIKKQKK